MNGWQRLGIVVSTVIAVPAFLVTHDEVRSFSDSYPQSDIVQSLRGQQFNDAAWREFLLLNPEGRQCDWRTVKVHRYASATETSFTCKKAHLSAFDESVWALVIPFVVVFGIGYTAAWVRHGFQKAP